MRFYWMFGGKKTVEIVIQSINLRVEDKNKINHLATLRVFRNNNTFFFFLIRPIGFLSIRTRTWKPNVRKGVRRWRPAWREFSRERWREEKKVRIDWISSHTRSLSVLQQSTFEWFQWSNRIRARVVSYINFIDSNHESNILLCYV